MRYTPFMFMTRNVFGSVEKHWQHQDGDSYVITGVDKNNRRIKPIVLPTWFFADGYNLWRGSKWLVRDGKRYLIQRIRN